MSKKILKRILLTLHLLEPLKTLLIYTELIFARILSLVNSKFYGQYDIIFIRRDMIGDFIIWLGCAQRLRKYYGKRKFTLICSSFNFSLAKACGVFDELILFNTPSDYFKLFGVRCKTLISPTQSRSIRDEMIVTAIVAENKIAIDGDMANNIRPYLLKQEEIYTQIIKTPLSVMPEILRNTAFYNGLTGENKQIIFANLTSLITDTIKIEEAYYVINLGASEKWKRWPVNRFVQVAQAVSQRKKLLCVLVGSKQELSLSQQFLGYYRGKTFVLTGKTSLEEVISIIANAQFVITNDTSTVHISAACDVKCFCVVSGIHYGRFTQYPSIDSRKNTPIYITDIPRKCFGCGLTDWRVKLPECLEAMSQEIPVPCIERISVNSVIPPINSYLDAIS